MERRRRVVVTLSGATPVSPSSPVSPVSRFPCPAFVRSTSARHGPASACSASLVPVRRPLVPVLHPLDQRCSSLSGVRSSRVDRSFPAPVCPTSARPSPASVRPTLPSPPGPPALCPRTHSGTLVSCSRPVPLPRSAAAVTVNGDDWMAVSRWR